MGGLTSMPMPSTPSGVTLLTLSFAGDYERCRVLCETMDRFVPPEIQHWLAVPKADIPLFSTVANARRRLVAEDDLLPVWLRKLPMPGPAWRRRLGLPRRNIYLSLRGRPVRGWIAQQLMKLSAAARAGTEIVVHCDSDTAFVRPFGAADLVRHGRTRLFRAPGAGRTDMHAPWHRAASRLLGLPPADYHGADFIDNLVVWRRPNVERLLTHLAARSGREAFATLARTEAFSEYILYGVFCERVLGLEAAGHAASEQSLCATVWSAPDGAVPSLAIEPHHAAIGIQSTIAIESKAYREIVEATIRQAADQDRVAARAPWRRSSSL